MSTVITPGDAGEILDKLDQADDAGKTMWVLGGFDRMLEGKRYVDELNRSYDTDVNVTVDTEYHEYFNQRLLEALSIRLDASAIQYYTPRFKFFVDMEKIEKDLRDRIYDYALENEYSQFDYSDGDFHFVFKLGDKSYPWMSEFIAILPDTQEMSAHVLAGDHAAIYFYQ